MIKLEAKISMNEFYFGAEDGQIEASQSNFEELFYRNKKDFFKKLKDQSEFLVYGRKGTGKTVLIEYFNKRINKEKNAHSKIYNTQDFVENKLKNFHTSDIEIQEVETFWRYVLVNELAEILLKNKPIFTRKIFKIRSLKKEKNDIKMDILNKKHVVGKSQNWKSSGKLSKSIDKETTSLEGGYSNTNTSEITSNLEPSPYYKHITDLFSSLVNAHSKNKKFYLIYDEIDDLEDKVSDREQFYKLMIGLINAASKLNVELAKNGVQSKIIIAIRKDILTQLNTRDSNLNKKISSSGIELKWIDPLISIDIENYSLVDLILHKCRVSSNGLYDELNNEVLFKMLFDKKQGKKNIFKYIIDRSFGRPRDIIRFLNIYKELYPDDTFFDFEKIKSCNSAYSEWFYLELQNEMMIHEQQEDIELVISHIQSLKKATFTISDLRKHIEESIDEERYNSLDLKFIIGELFALSVLGNNTKRKGQAPTIEFVYRDAMSSKPDFNTRQTVHYGLRNHFGIR